MLLLSTEPKTFTKLRIVLIAVAVLAGLAVFSVAIVYSYHFGSHFSQDIMDWDHFGTYFGGTLGPILGFISLLGVLVTVYMQSDLVKGTRQQVQIAKDVAVINREGMSKQAVLLRQQSFESTFFQLIRLREDLITNIQVPVTAPNTISYCGPTGRKAFEAIVRDYLESEFTKHLRGDIVGTQPDQWLRLSYQQFLDLKGQDFLSYLRLTIELLDLIDAYGGDQSETEKLEESYAPDQARFAWSPIHNKNTAKQRYATIALAPLTYYELLMIALYACTGKNSTHKEGLIMRYGMLRHIPESPPHLANNEMGSEQQLLYTLRKIYEDMAFKTPGARH